MKGVLLRGSSWRWMLAFAVGYGAMVLVKQEELFSPYFWDEILGYYYPSRWVHQHGPLSALPGLHDRAAMFFHPTALPFTYSLFYRLFGVSVLTSRLASLLFSSLAMFLLFHMGRQLAGPWVGLAAVTMSFFDPLFFTYSTTMVADLLLTTSGLLLLYFWRRGNDKGLLAVGLYVGFLRASSLAITWGIFTYEALVVLREIRAGKRPTEVSWRRPIVALASSLPLLLFFLSDRIITGEFFSHKAIGDFLLRPSLNLRIGANILYKIFIQQGRIFHITGVLLLSLSLLMIRKRKGPLERSLWHEEFLLYLIIIAYFILGLSLDVGVLFRYLLPIIPLLYLMISYYLHLALGSRPLMVLALSVMAYSSFQAAHAEKGYFAEDMGLFRVTKLFKEAAVYLKANHAEDLIVTEWPFTQILTDPDLQYLYKTFPEGRVIGAAQLVGARNKEREVLVMHGECCNNLNGPLYRYAVEKKLKLEKLFFTSQSMITIFHH